LSSDGLDVRVEDVRERSNDGRGVRLGGIIEVWEGAFDGLLVLDVGSGACGITGTLSLRAGDAAPERPTTGSDAPD
jgi:hypothetical protein